MTVVAAGCGRPAGSRLCSPAGGAYGAPGRRPQPHRAAPRHAAPHLAPQRTRIKGTDGGQSRRGVSLAGATELTTGLDPRVPDPYHKENTPFFGRT